MLTVPSLPLPQAMTTVDVDDAKTRLCQLVDQAVAGEDVVISRQGKPLVRITRLSPPKRQIRFGVLRGKLQVPADFNEPLSDGAAGA